MKTTIRTTLATMAAAISLAACSPASAYTSAKPSTRVAQAACVEVGLLAFYAMEDLASGMTPMAVMAKTPTPSDQDAAAYYMPLIYKLLNAVHEGAAEMDPEVAAASFTAGCMSELLK